ncbi:aminotransferase class V-fold PLP-dependent enzyme [Trichocoleus sp. FACHB-262]|uniref:aminotransferase class V-fold PLP-dependent enzyme n=1 Tax=Trichocoleus sp. FACHB-262 TaxID=2692869 RepID=UPI001683CE60|nr:aminotransferase class V-fold PLP-dependent enzyme [Trichocoleus sp. FACHB-262]MBD2123647.1 aminotransferase class V-fold PLP-dependent enzyme [Trichocoleus sp. FACHB-262]
MRPEPDKDWSKFWWLKPDVTFLNHGAFGACPKPVLEVQQQFRLRLEQQPLRFLAQDLEGLLDSARQVLAEFVGADPLDLVFVPNATTGINTVLRSLHFTPDDELLTTNHEYNACRNALDFVAARSGAQVVVAEIPLPIQSPQQVIEAVVAKISPKTRLALLDHVTSQTGLVMPIQALVRELSQRGIDTLIDGAHAPGTIPLSLPTIGATYYTGNCHKWLCAPKGAAFLYVQRDRQAQIRPLTISHGANSPRTDRSRFRLEFDWPGTYDPSAYLSVPTAIEFLGGLLPGGWPELMASNRAKALAARKVLCEALNVSPPCPDEMIAALAVVPLPDGSYQALQISLLNQYGIEVPIVPWPGGQKRLVRVAAQIYNTVSQYEYLAQALVKLLAAEAG